MRLLYYWVIIFENFIANILLLNGESINTPRTNDSIVIAVDQQFASSNSLTISDVIGTYKGALKGHYAEHVSVQFTATLDVKFMKDLTAILATGSCKDIWNLYETIDDKDIMYLIITDNQCTRLPTTETITIPLSDPGTELSQLILDLRTSGAITWDSVTVIHDDSIDDDLVNNVITALTSNSEESVSIMVFKLHSGILQTDWERRKMMYEMFMKFPKYEVHNTNYLVISKFDNVAMIMEMSKTFGLATPQTEWLIIIPDANTMNYNMETFTGLIEEGENYSFIINTSRNNKSCKGGLLCHVDELLHILVYALEKSFLEEKELSQHVSEEEWETIRPLKNDRRDSLISFMRVRLAEIGVCSNCTSWNFISGLTWGNEFLENRPGSELLPTGMWQVQNGPKLYDSLFPHVSHGFRRKKLPVMTFHYPPWQILEFNETGHVSKYTGLIFDIVNELSRSLNFTSNIIIASNNTRGFSNDTRGSSSVEIYFVDVRGKDFIVDNNLVDEMLIYGQIYPVSVYNLHYDSVKHLYDTYSLIARVI